MMSDHEWDPQSIDLYKIRKISQARRMKCSVFWVKQDTVYPSPSLNLVEGVYAYQDPTSDEAILFEINPSPFQIKELYSAQINIQYHDHKQFLARRTFFSWKRHSDLTAESSSEIWGVGPKRAKATLLATTQNGTISAIMPLSRQNFSYRMYNIMRLRGRFVTHTFYGDMKSLHEKTCCQVLITLYLLLMVP